ncbi:sugar phosphate isomerase/epimerase family protein [Aquisphaera insulae]|uniref:sugar phosphate isomerase/epimerase family protein n=1 Tax=Aquisphaera insulae TaxID=2712864 RepID=UPI0013EAAAEA|nr:TIM barrel protein [Aquisphaera insulae]
MTRGFLDHRTTRRAFLGGAAALAGGAMLPRRILGAEDARPNSVFGGVHVGCITYSYRGEAHTAEETLKALVEDGLSETELMGDVIQSYAGVGRGHSDADRRAQLAKCVELRKMFNDAGVNIHIQKHGFGRSDDAIDFNFEIAKALGCKAITTERNEGDVKRLAPFAEKHKIWVAFHNHTNNIPTIEDIDPLMQAGDYVGFNLDIGHYVAGNKGKSPIPVLEKYHDKIISLHLKDRTAAGANLPWGRGQTPIKEVLQLLKEKKWPIYADIELEYPVPKDSTAVKEVAKCVAYCKEALA